MLQLRLKDALRNPRIYEHITKLYVQYNPDIGKEILSVAETGWGSDQYVESLWGIGWHPFLFKNKVYLVPERETFCTMIHLHMDIGTKGETKVLKKVASLYSNLALKAKGVPITIEMLESMPLFLRLTNRRSFLASGMFKNHRRGLWFAGYNGEPLIFKEKNIFHKVLEADVRPVILLPSNVLVTLGFPGRDGKTPLTGLPIVLTTF